MPLVSKNRPYVSAAYEKSFLTVKGPPFVIKKDYKPFKIQMRTILNKKSSNYKIVDRIESYKFGMQQIMSTFEII